MDVKICFKCNKEKKITEFYKHDKMADGYLGKCKECTKKDALQYREKNIERIRRCDRKRGNLPHRIAARNNYAKTDNGRIAGSRAKKKWIKRNPERRAAHTLLENAIRKGKIKKQPCERCGSTYRIHGHHDDYCKPLEVIWLCPKCHATQHKKLQEIMSG